MNKTGTDNADLLLRRADPQNPLLNLPGIVGAFLAGLAVNAARDGPEGWSNLSNTWDGAENTAVRGASAKGQALEIVGT
jgi:hypothetical protein